MTLPNGTRFGPYEILAPLGSGGMGEVYRARDTRLGRDVAVKVLPQHLSQNPEVRARFEREAKTVSSLNHPNICTLFDVGREGDSDYLVLELVDGETLATRIARGPLPAAEVLRIAIQIADALERAHRAGVVHRDLKPGNIMLTRSGAKLMDFGLARATGLAGGLGSGVTVAGLTQSPTIAQPLTAEGTIIGTFQYMSPEQLEGKEADERSDIWALGCVLYEMATGTRAFEGKSQASLIATIMHSEPKPLHEIVPASPPSLQRLTRECLAKDPEERRQSAGDIRRELNRIARNDADTAPAGAAKGSRLSRLALLAAVGVLAAAGGYLWGHRGHKAPESSRIAFTIPAPPGNRFRFTIEEDGSRLAAPVISSDGRQIAFGVVDEKGHRTLLCRSMDDAAYRPVPGSIDARSPFWSPDGQALGFFAEGRLCKVNMAGGSPVIVCGGANNARGATWSRSGTILYAPSANSGLYTVNENGGTPVQVTFLDTTLPDISHRWPVFLPDDKHFVFLVWTNNAVVRDSIGGLYLGELGSREVERIDATASNAVYVDGSLVFARDGLLVRAPFNPSDARLGDAVPTEQHVEWDASTGLALFDLSHTGTLVSRETGAWTQTRLVWFDRAGTPMDTVAGAADYRQISIARDGRVAAMNIGNAGGDADVWLLDFDRELSIRHTANNADEDDVLISADGRDVAYTCDVNGPYEVFVGPADRNRGAERISPPSDDWTLGDWSLDGRLMLLATSTHLWVLDVPTQQGEEWHAVQGSLATSAGCFSPDARWIAYVSPESGREEIYVRPYPGPGGQWQVSTAGGLRPHWSNDGREIAYMSLDGDLVSVAVETGNGFRTQTPRRLFRIGPRIVWAAAGDHSRFLVAVRPPNATDPPIRVITGWLNRAP